MISIEKQSINPTETHNSNSHLLTNNTEFPEMLVLGEFVAYFSVSVVFLQDVVQSTRLITGWMKCSSCICLCIEYTVLQKG